MLRSVFRYLFSAFAILGLLVVISLVVTAVLAVRTLSEQEVELPESFVLTVDAPASIVERPAGSPLSGLGTPSLAFYDLVRMLDAASRDDRVEGVAMILDPTSLNLAQSQEVRDRVLALRRAGKKTHVFARDVPSLGNLALLAAFEDVTLPPAATLAITGVALEMPFARDLLDEIGLQPQFVERYEFKGAANVVTDSDLPAPQRDNLSAVVDSLFAQTVASIATDRVMDRDTLLGLIDRAPLSAEDGEQQGLIDRTLYLDQWVDAVKAAFTSRASHQDYLAALRQARGDIDQAFALIHVLGAITSDGDSGDLLPANLLASAQGAIGALKSAAASDNIRAVILRIDSPGGAFEPSDRLWRTIAATAEKKPVIVSMGSTAASGGYLAAVAGSYIIAAPGTLTGSIGVVGGKMVFADLWDKIGVNFAQIARGEHALLFSPNTPFSDSERAAFTGLLDHVYETFTGKVMAARGIATQEMDELARGRIFTGAQAAENGLIDGTGGLIEAVQVAREQTGLAPNEPVRLVLLPRPKSAPERIIELLGRGGLVALFDRSGLPAGIPARLAEPAAFLQVIGESPTSLLMPPIRVH